MSRKSFNPLTPPFDLTFDAASEISNTPAGNIIATTVQAAIDELDSEKQPLDADLTTWAGITPGTGVGTALAVNVGTAGAFVVNGGVLGTPSSGTVTNLTGTASININGTVGATTPTTATFTTATINTNLVPDANDGAGLGLAGTAFSDLFLAEGGVINWDSSDITLTQAGNTLTLAGADTFAHGTADITNVGDITGQSGGITLYGGTAAANALTLQANSSGLNTVSTDGRININDPMEILIGDRTFTDGPGGILRVNSTYTLNFASAALGSFILFNPTVVLEQTASAFSMGNLFNNGATIKNAAGEANNFGPWYTLSYVATMQADGATITQGQIRALNFNGVWNVINAGVFTTTSMHEIYIGGNTNIGASTTVTTLNGFKYLDPGTVAGTLVNQFAIDIDPLSNATTINVGIRNAAPTVFTPSTTQVIDAVGDNPLADATFIKLNNNTGASITLTDAAIIADGQSGQILIIEQIGAQNVVLTNTNNLRLAGAANLTLGQYDTVTLIYDTSSAQWVQIAASNN